MAKRLRCFQPCYIEELPDEILGDIVSRLKTNDAARSCAVSKRWSKLWTLSSCTNLDFDFPYKKHSDNNAAFRLNSAMNKHKKPHVDNLRIAYHDDTGPFNYSFNDSNFSEWFKFSNVKNVKSLVMDIKAPIVFPDSMLLDFYPYLTPKVKILALFDLESWDRLTTVSLKSAIMLDWDIDTFLSKVPNLETLLLDNIPFENLEVKDTNPKLKRLEIVHCAVLKGIHFISAPNLKCFKHVPLVNKYYKSLRGLQIKKKREPYADDDTDFSIITNINLRFEHTTNLRAIYLGGPLCINLLSKIQKHAPELQKLQLNIDLNCDHDECRKLLRTVPTFENLKQLQLTFSSTRKKCRDHGNMNTIINTIHSCPSLEKLILKYEIQKADTNGKNYCCNNERCPNEFLKEVEIVGWSGLRSETELVRYLIRTSPKLQSLSLDPTPPHQTETSWSGVFSPVKRSKHELEYAALAAQELIGRLHNKLAK